MSNSTHCHGSPPIPTYTLSPVAPLSPFISDIHLSLLIPLVTYWTLGLFFQFLDKTGGLQQYRIHTSAESETRNHISGAGCLRGVLLNQLLQTLLGIAAGWRAEADVHGDEMFQVAVWAARTRVLWQSLPSALAVLAIDTGKFTESLPTHSVGLGDLLTRCTQGGSFSAWELRMGEAIYYIAILCFQFILAVLISDSWQYFGHRWMHSNRFMYSKYLHVKAHSSSFRITQNPQSV